MDLKTCAYCGWEGLVIVVRPTEAGFDLTGKCHVCGYSYDSEYAPAEHSDDLLCEISQPIEFLAQD